MKKDRKPSAQGMMASVVTITVMLLFSVAAVVMYYLTGYLPLLLSGVVFVIPALVNLVLYIPIPRNKLKPEPAIPSDEGETPEKKRFFKKITDGIIKVLRKIGFGFKTAVWYLKTKRTAVTAILVALAVAGANYVYWISVKLTSTYTLTVYVPLVLAGMFVVFIVLEKWCRHVTAAGIAKVVIGNLKGVLAVGKFIWLAFAVSTAFCLLGFFDITKYLIILLTVYFIYFTVFTVLGASVRLIRAEFDTNPDLSVPLPGQKGENMNIISYLEENTGITMRSLWSMRIIKMTVPYAVMACVGVLWLSTGIVQIEASQHGALYRLGKLSDTPLEPGLHFTLPWPVDSVEIYDTDTVKEVTVGYVAEESADNYWTKDHGTNEYKLLLGGGEELVSINLRIHYKINDLMSYLKNSAAPVSLLESAAYEIVTERTIVTDLDTMLSTDRAAFTESFKQELTERVSDFKTGIEVVSVIIESIHPPVEIANIYQQIISAEIYADQLILEAEDTAEVTVTDATREYYKTVNGAKASSLESVANAKASVAEFMASVEADKSYSDAYRYYKYLKAIESAYADAKLVIVGDGVDSSNLYLGNIN